MSNDDNLHDRLNEEGIVILASLDESQPYEVDESYILWDKINCKLTLVTASSCSSWTGGVR